MEKNAEPNNSEYGHFSRSAKFLLDTTNVILIIAVDMYISYIVIQLFISKVL